MKSGDFLGGTVVRICLPMQGTQVQFLVWEDSTWRGAPKACAPQLLRLLGLELVLHNKRSHHSEKPMHHN